MKTINKNIIAIDALQGALSAENIKELEECVVGKDICIETYSHSPRYMNGIEDLYAQIQVICSQELILAIFTGVLGSGIYDVLKTFLCKLYSKMKGQHITKIQSNKIEKVEPKIHFVIGDIKVVLPLDIDDEKYKYFVDKMFESMRDERITKKEFCTWNKDTGEVEYYSYTEILSKVYSEGVKSR